MRKTFSAFVLVLALGSTVFAGDIPSPPAPTHDSTANTSFTSEETGSLSGEAQSADDPTADLFAGAALTLLNSVLTLF